MERDQDAGPWPPLRIIRYPAARVATLGVPALAAGVLTRTGLPNAVDTLFTAAARLEAAPQGPGVQFGTAWHDEYTLLVGPDEQVRAWHPDGPELSFVNTDLGRFLAFLAHAEPVFRDGEQAGAGLLSEADYLADVRRRRDALRALDPRAVGDQGWWAGIVEEWTMI
jgi:hypothetical protein